MCSKGLQLIKHWGDIWGGIMDGWMEEEEGKRNQLFFCTHATDCRCLFVQDWASELCSDTPDICEGMRALSLRTVFHRDVILSLQYSKSREITNGVSQTYSADAYPVLISYIRLFCCAFYRRLSRLSVCVWCGIFFCAYWFCALKQLVGKYGNISANRTFLCLREVNNLSYQLIIITNYLWKMWFILTCILIEFCVLWQTFIQWDIFSFDKSKLCNT